MTVILKNRKLQRTIQLLGSFSFLALFILSVLVSSVL